MCRGVPAFFPAFSSLILLICARAPSCGEETNFFEITRSELTGPNFGEMQRTFLATFFRFFYVLPRNFPTNRVVDRKLRLIVNGVIARG